MKTESLMYAQVEYELMELAERVLLCTDIMAADSEDYEAISQKISRLLLIKRCAMYMYGEELPLPPNIVYREGRA